MKPGDLRKFTVITMAGVQDLSGKTFLVTNVNEPKNYDEDHTAKILVDGSHKGPWFYRFVIFNSVPVA